MSEPLNGPYRSREEERGESLVPAQRKPDQLQMTDIRDRIAAVHIDHQFALVNHSSIGSEDHCRCGFRPRGWLAWSKHVADAVIAELGRYEYAVASDDLEVICMYVDDRSGLDGVPLHEDERIVRRYVTKWENADTQPTTEEGD